MPATDHSIALSIAQVKVVKIDGANAAAQLDALAVEEPLEIRLGFDAEISDVPVGGRSQKSISVTMRTPGHDDELAAGFLVSEGIVTLPDEIETIRCCVTPAGVDNRNIVRVELKSGVEVDLARLERHFYTSSSCGVCGKTSIEAVQVGSGRRATAAGPLVEPAVIHALPGRLREAQAVFARTGGLHASALFDPAGILIGVREDVGRHNALDKLIGWQFMAAALPLNRAILLLSGRISFELVQKAMMAGIPIVAAVGAPSSLAVELAAACGMTLLGFVRNDRFNIYSGPARVQRQ